jgi:signal transduction histidine kinase
VLSAAGLRERLALEDRGMIDALEADVRRADGVIKGFLKLARTTAGEMTGVSIDGLVREVIEQWRPRAEASGGAIEPEIEPDLGEVRASPKLLSEALANLIANAIEASTEGASVRLTASRRAEGGVDIAVHDAGPGIPAEVLPRIFEAYYTTKESGTGIGLPLVRQIAALHGGTVAVDSVEGRGTTVTISLPEVRA